MRACRSWHEAYETPRNQRYAQISSMPRDGRPPFKSLQNIRDMNYGGSTTRHLAARFKPAIMERLEKLRLERVCKEHGDRCGKRSVKKLKARSTANFFSRLRPALGPVQIPGQPHLSNCPGQFETVVCICLIVFARRFVPGLFYDTI